MAGVACILLMLSSVAASAADADVSISYTVAPYVALSIGEAHLTRQDQTVLAFPAVTQADRERGFMEQDEPVDLTVIANTSWTLTAELVSPIRLIGDGLNCHQGAVLSWTTLPSGVYTEFPQGAGQTPQLVSSGDRGVHELLLRYRLEFPTLKPECSMKIESVDVVVLYTVVAD